MKKGLTQEQADDLVNGFLIGARIRRAMKLVKVLKEMEEEEAHDQMVQAISNAMRKQS